MTQQQIDEAREGSLELPELIAAVEKLLRDGDEFARQMAEFRVDEISPLPAEIGNFHEPKLTAMRRLLCGQTLGISRRVVREILRHLKGVAQPQPTPIQWHPREVAMTWPEGSVVRMRLDFLGRYSTLDLHPFNPLAMKDSFWNEAEFALLELPQTLTKENDKNV